MIRSCICKHPSQDTLHGKFQRVFNPILKNSTDPTKVYARCTVCSTEKLVKK